MIPWVTIDIDIPIPPKRPTGRPPNCRQTRQIPWVRMQIGDSILLRDTTIERAVQITHSPKRNHNMRFTSRVVEGGVRVWRIA